MKLIDATHLIFSADMENNKIHVKDIIHAPEIDPIHAANACYCEECLYYKPFRDYRDYPDCSKKLPYGYCYYWKYEEGESPNEVDENDFCSKGVPKNA